ncbi:MAG: NADP-dependent phosphogluconate dehydrogenase [Chloroflexi bacterium]|nr:NADP-dependent phosphogluconate dehydrogenase [Chloroflexota bacterium]
MNHPIGIIGLGAMGANLALNLASHGYPTAGYDSDPAKRNALLAQVNGLPLTTAASLPDLLAQLPSPRAIILLVPAGASVDAVCGDLLEAGIAPEDSIIDCGNSFWEDTAAREAKYSGRFRFVGAAVSGGAEGARHGPSLMVGGDPASWAQLRPMWEAISAKFQGEPCVAYMGTGGAGHFVKMVHNGIEYADMQLIAEVYHYLRYALHFEPTAIADLFANWNEGELASYLLQISAAILRQPDGLGDGLLLDKISDRAGQKGTGSWTVAVASQLGVPIGVISEAVNARLVSHMGLVRQGAAQHYAVQGVDFDFPPVSTMAYRAKKGLYIGRIVAYAQGFHLLQKAAEVHGWLFDYGRIAAIWRAGCIIRADLLQPIMAAFAAQPTLPNLLLDPHLAAEVNKRWESLRAMIPTAAFLGAPIPCHAAAFNYLQTLLTPNPLPTNLIQAQRDYFGAHTYERVDAAVGEHFHTEWGQ